MTFIFKSFGDHRDLHSFPTRRSSDLDPPVPRTRSAKTARGTRSAGRRARRDAAGRSDRKSTRLNSSHPSISYAVFCLKKKTDRMPLLERALTPGALSDAAYDQPPART